jgi:hypothetical protein
MTTRALRVLLEGLIDYAGLFPPAALPMDEAVRNYELYREGEHAWALGKFVVPLDRAAEVPTDFPRSVLGVDEVKASSAEELERIARESEGRTVYVEITDRALLPRLARLGLRAKIRTGGVTPEAFPPIGDVARFLRECKAAGVGFKATAGLHHPLRCVKALTYEPGAPTGTMHGFLNVFLAAALLDDAEDVLAESDPRAFVFTDGGVRWRDRFVSTDELRLTRQFATSFGSCSFEEPIGDLRELGLL